MREITIYKSDLSNLLVDRTKSMVNLIIFVLPFLVKDESQTAMFETEKSALPNNFDQFHLNCSGECNVHYHKTESRGISKLQIQIIAAITYRIYVKMFLLVCSVFIKQ